MYHYSSILTVRMTPAMGADREITVGCQEIPSSARKQVAGISGVLTLAGGEADHESREFEVVPVARGLLLAGLAACWSGSSGGRIATGPPPSEMCEAGAPPMLAAYDLDTGKYQWSVCTTEAEWRTVAEASDAAVTVSNDGQLASFEANTGAALESGRPVESDGQRRSGCGPDRDMASMLIDGVCLTGGQDDPFTAYEAASGNVLWTEPNARLPYDDVWTVGDGAVYLGIFSIHSDGTPPSPREVPRLAALEVRTGATRWARDVSAAVNAPWYVKDGLLFTIWTNLSLISTKDGSILWHTDFPMVEFPRISGVRSNASRVFISFTMVRSGGD
jgi:outer membrane protein assembly factor BamB